MKASLSVREATVCDVPLICDFVLQLAHYEHLAHEVKVSELNFRHYLFTDPPNPKPEVFIVAAKTDDAAPPIGVCLFIHILPSTVYLEDLFVSESARGSGGGLALLRALARETIKRKAQYLEWVCLDWNMSSIKFYESLGAVALPDRKILRITGNALRNRITSLDGLVSSPFVGTLHHTNSASLEYTLSFSTFLATPVILIVSWTCRDIIDLVPLIDYLIAEANARAFARVDVRVHSAEVAAMLAAEFQAIEMVGWIPFRLEGSALQSLAY